jgi:D-alanyl-D-alanine carboxypeptidase
MTLYLLFDAIKKRKINFNTKFRISAQAAKQISSKLYLKTGEHISVKKIIKALIIKSANDAAVVAAEGLCGSVEKFVSVMNHKAKRLGMHKTNFCNPSGVPDKNQKTTARDMAILAKALFSNFPEFINFFKLRSFTYNGKKYLTHNHILNKFQGANGMKTGYIDASGYNLSTSAIRYDSAGKQYNFLVVIIGQNSPEERDKEAINLLEHFFLKKRAVYYNADASTLSCKYGIPLSNNKNIAKNNKKKIIRAQICTKEGITFLLDEYLKKQNRYKRASSLN